MLSNDLSFLFDAPCTVCELSSHTVVYPIFKNGSTTIKSLPHIEYVNQQIGHRCSEISVYLRDPLERMASGLNTYLEGCGGLAEDTVVYYVQTFPFLNRHFMPQFFWLLNLGSYANSSTVLHLKPLSAISELTSVQLNKRENERLYAGMRAEQIIKGITDIAYYLELEDFLMSFVGKETNWETIVTSYKKTMPTHYNQLFNTVTRIANALPEARSLS